MELNERFQTKKILKKARELSQLLDIEKNKLKQINYQDLVLKLQQACDLIDQSIIELDNYEGMLSGEKKKKARPKAEIDFREIDSITVDNFLIKDSYSVYKYFEEVLFTEYVINPDDALKKLSLSDLKYMYFLLTSIQIKGKTTKNEVFGSIKSYLDNQKRTKTML